MRGVRKKQQFAEEGTTRRDKASGCQSCSLRSISQQSIFRKSHVIIEARTFSDDYNNSLLKSASPKPLTLFDGANAVVRRCANTTSQLLADDACTFLAAKKGNGEQRKVKEADETIDKVLKPSCESPSLWACVLGAFPFTAP